MPNIDDIPIKDLEISVRTETALLEHGIRTVGQAKLISDQEYLSFDHFGRKCLNELRGILDELIYKPVIKTTSSLPSRKEMAEHLRSSGYVVIAPDYEILEHLLDDAGYMVVPPDSSFLNSRFLAVAAVRLSGKTLEVAGQTAGVKRERARQICEKYVRFIQHYLRSNGHPDGS